MLIDRIAAVKDDFMSSETRPSRMHSAIRRLVGESALFGATVTVALCALLAKAIVLGRDLAIAYRFGRGEALDAFLLANLLPLTALSAIVGPIGFAVLPVLAQRARAGSAPLWNRLAQSTFVAAVGMICIGAILLALLGPVLLALMADGTLMLSMSRSVLWWLIPAFALQGVAGYLALLVRAQERHAAVSLVPAITPLVTMMLVLWGGFGARALVVGMLAGSAIECVLVTAVARHAGIRVGLPFQGFDPQLREVLRRYAAVAVAATLMSATLVVDQGVAATLGTTGSVAAINYGTRLTSMLLALLATPLATAALPHFSHAVASGNLDAVRRTFWRYAATLFSVSTVAVVVLAAFSHDITRLLFQRGAFGAEDTIVVGSLQAIYVLVFPFVLVEQLGVRVLAAVGTTRALAGIATLNFVLNLALDVIFMHVFGLRGIAAATVTVGVFSAAIVAFSVSRVAGRSRGA